MGRAATWAGVSRALSFLQCIRRARKEFPFPQGFAWKGLVHLIKHDISTPHNHAHTNTTSPPSSSLEESQVGFTRLFLLLLNSARLVNNSAGTQPTNKLAGSTNGQKGRWENERERPRGCKWESDSLCWSSFSTGKTSSKKQHLLVHSLQLYSHPLQKQGVYCHDLLTAHWLGPH